MPLLVLFSFKREPLFARNGSQFNHEVRKDRGKEPSRSLLLDRMPNLLDVLKRVGPGSGSALCVPSGPLLFLSAGNKLNINRGSLIASECRVFPDPCLLRPLSLPPSAHAVICFLPVSPDGRIAPAGIRSLLHETAIHCPQLRETGAGKLIVPPVSCLSCISPGLHKG